MTAIAGFWGFDGRPDSLAQCRFMLAAQAEYGRDRPRDAQIGSLALGLKLYRLVSEDAHDCQPLISPDARYALVADARLDNREELRTALAISAGECLRFSDAELIFRALQRWQDAALPKLVGDYAFAFFDASSRRLLLARDPLGQRPLFWHRGRNFIAFSSMPKGLHGLAEVPLAANGETVGRYLALLPPKSSSSFYAQVQRVQPGHVTELTEDRTLERRHWVGERRRLGLKSFDDYVEAYRLHLDQAVASRLRRVDGPVATHLSGGWDSSAVTATAARLLPSNPGEVIAFTSVPPSGATCSLLEPGSRTKARSLVRRRSYTPTSIMWSSKVPGGHRSRPLGLCPLVRSAALQPLQSSLADGDQERR
jgi:asparagine synthase (glutamine-hydrolysing)